MTTNENDIRRLLDIEEIRRLKLRYAELCDTGYDPDALTDLFTEDGVFEVPGVARHVGTEQIHEHWIALPKLIDFALHFVTNHIVEVGPSGLTATGRPYILGVTKQDGEAYWQGIRYQEEYRKVEGRWLFALIRLNLAFNTPYDRSWADQVQKA